MTLTITIPEWLAFPLSLLVIAGTASAFYFCRFMVRFVRPQESQGAREVKAHKWVLGVGESCGTYGQRSATSWKYVTCKRCLKLKPKKRKKK